MKKIRDRVLTVAAAVALAGGVGLATTAQTAAAEVPVAAPQGGVATGGYGGGGAAYSTAGGFATVSCWSCIIYSYSPSA